MGKKEEIFTVPRGKNNFWKKGKGHILILCEYSPLHFLSENFKACEFLGEEV